MAWSPNREKALVVRRFSAVQRSLQTAIAFLGTLLLSGCGLNRAPVIDAHGPIAVAERDLMFAASGIMLIVIVPVLVMTFLFAWRYRASNEGARYTPDWSYSTGIDFVIWLIPVFIVVALGILVWGATHRLDPYRQIDGNAPALEIHVVAQDWKWLFIYPDEGVASVNRMVFPAGKPVRLNITADTVMNSFYIPALAGQIYAMAGMRTELHFLAGTPGTFTGRNTQYSGRGFASQHFQAVATSPEDFEAWLAEARQSELKLDAAAYRLLAAPSIGHPVQYFSAVEPDLFDKIIARYGGDHIAHRSAQ
jgi:cytochrome o ubiquinol oxidase subunit 2